MRYKLDATDKKILFEMDDNCRQSYSAIAEKVRISKQAVKYRIERLVKRGIITSFYALIDISKLGFSLYRVHYKLQQADHKKEMEIIEYFSKHPFVLWVASTGGRWEIVIDIMARNVVHLDRILNEIDNHFPQNLQNKDILILIDAYHYKRSYLLGKIAEEKVAFVGGEPKEMDIDNTDKRILSVLAKNAKISLIELAEKSGTTTDIVRYRMRKFQERGLITGYRALIHPNTYGFETYKMLIKLQNAGKKEFKSLFAFGNLHPNITYALKTIGMWDFEFEMEVESSERFKQIVMEVKNKFRTAIRDYEMLRIFYDHMFNYYPLQTQ